MGGLSSAWSVTCPGVARSRTGCEQVDWFPKLAAFKGVCVGCTQVAERRQTGAPPGAAAPSATPSSQQQVTLPDLSFPSPAPSNLEQAYKEALQPLTVSDFDSSATSAYNR